ncbi:bis(5'-nucleosyl)-tetraphosphatase (symmetrical) YqeK [Acetoanaerobium noterae]|nr:bis(5'-nucleosyl)-tetraphosphatase (symmetrical) YqeK [Acetoanaerobium noterae]
MIELKKNVSEKRYIHILGVIDSADELAEKFSVSKEKARLAAIFHDYAKGMSKKSMLEFAKANKLDFDDIEYGNKELMHGKIARYIAQNNYNVNDNDVLNAIEFHTTGRKKMSKLEKLICLADYIEKNREYPGVDKIRNLVDIDYNLALYTAFNGTIIHLIEENKIVHTRTVEARNYLLSILNEKGVCV